MRKIMAVLAGCLAVLAVAAPAGAAVEGSSAGTGGWTGKVTLQSSIAPELKECVPADVENVEVSWSLTYDGNARLRIGSVSPETLKFDKDELAPGEVATATTTGHPGDDIVVEVIGAAAGNSVSGTVRLPARCPEPSSSSASASASASFSTLPVAAESTSPTTSAALPVTGAPMLTLLVVGFVMFSIGSIAIIAARRRSVRFKA